MEGQPACADAVRFASEVFPDGGDAIPAGRAAIVVRRTVSKIIEDTEIRRHPTVGPNTIWIPVGDAEVGCGIEHDLGLEWSSEDRGGEHHSACKSAGRLPEAGQDSVPDERECPRQPR